MVLVAPPILHQLAIISALLEAIVDPEKRKTTYFGPFEFDLDTLELRKQGERIPLRNQPAEVLALLLRRANELVTREEIRQQVWTADSAVDFEQSLNSCIRQIRSALG